MLNANDFPHMCATHSLGAVKSSECVIFINLQFCCLVSRIPTCSGIRNLSRGNIKIHEST